jgi:3,2-trans-enoyl-CoA isomerase
MASCPPRSSFLRIEQKNSYAIVTLIREPVNTMNMSMWEQLAETLDTLEANPKIRGVIFQSGLQRDVFTAGNDIMELYAPNTSQERYR